MFRPSGGPPVAVMIGGDESDPRANCFADEVVIDFPSVAPAVEWPFTVGGISIAPCLGARIGVARLDGTAAQSAPLPLASATERAPWGGPTLALVVSGGSEHVRVALRAEAGWAAASVAATVLAHDTPVVDGPFFGFLAELAIAP